MRINVYAEELDKDNPIAIISKTIYGHEFTALRWSLYLPVTMNNDRGERVQVRGPFMHRPGDDDSSAVTFWGKQDLRPILRKSLALLDAHYAKKDAERDATRARAIALGLVEHNEAQPVEHLGAGKPFLPL